MCSISTNILTVLANFLGIIIQPFSKSIGRDRGNTTYDINEGPYYSFNQAWEWVFQCADNEKEHLVVRGKYGLDLVQPYVVHFLKVSGIEVNNGLHLVAKRVESLIALIETM
jgi:hypothetical protein